MAAWRRSSASCLVRCVRLSALAGVLVLCGGGAQAQVSVSSSGSPSYSQAIAVPPGISGMQPNLSLMYAGGGVNGPVGHGWSVQGISMITRCPATRYTDAVPRGVRFDKDDKLCLDGQRLIQTNASGTVTPAAVYDGNGKLTSFPQVDDARGLSSGYREYRTEKDSFARIRAYGIANGSDANGPAYFKVWTKAGQVYEYGAAPSADANTKAAVTAQGQNVVMVWAAARISDVVGNYIDFKYEVRDVAWGSGPHGGSTTPGREWNVTEIQYTGNGAQVPTNKVVFGYSDRTETWDRGEAYQRGSKNVSIRRLNTIDTYVNSPNNTALGPAAGATLVKRIRLAYDNSSATKRSRLASIKECVDVAETKCLPPTSLSYANGGSEAFVAHAAFASSALSTTQLRTSTGTVGTEIGDFNGDGLSDLLKWSNTAANNRLYLNTGGANFQQVPVGTGAGQFNITDRNIFSDGGCAGSLIMDFNGDGLTDVFSYIAQGDGGCSTAPTYLYLSRGDGSFDRRTVSGVTLAKNQGNTLNCPLFDDSNCTQTQRDTFYVMDIDGDALPDVVKTWIPEHISPGRDPSDATALCAGTVCTRVYKGDGQGGFAEIPGPLSISNKALFQWPYPLSDSVSGKPALSQQRYVADVDGDGFADIVLGLTGSGGQTAWRSLGNGDFEVYAAPTDAEDCNYRVDFNGDGRAECLWPSSTVTSSRLTASTGTQLQRVAFNLAVSGGPGLKGDDKGVRVLDINGDGRTDILRWHDTAGQTYVYLSNGDGSFTQSSTFNLGSVAANRLVTSGGTYEFVAGDFTGDGSLEILRLHGSPSSGEAGTNQLYVKSDPTLPDQLLSVISPSGIRTTLTYDSLANPSSGRYSSDRSDPNLKASYPLIDLTIASPVVVTMETDVGVGSSKVQTQFAYKGLKAAVDGRGMLGFRQTVQQNTAPNGDALSIWTDYLLNEPYAGVARRSQTRKGLWSEPNAQLLSTTTNTYCDRTSATDPNSATDAAPCATNARITRPYLRKSVEEGTDLGGHALPKVTTVNTYNDHGDPTTIVVTTEGVMANLASQTFTKTTANVFCAPDGTCPDASASPNKISGDNWILGRLSKSTVTNVVPNLLTALTTTAGTVPNAAAIAGTLTQSGTLTASLAFGTVVLGSNSTLVATLANTGTMDLGVTVPSAASVTGTDFSFVSTTCTSLLQPGATCTTSVRFTPTAAVARTGTLSIVTANGTKTSSLSGTGTQQTATLSSSLAFGNVVVGSSSTLNATLTNTGNMALTVTVPGAGSVTGTDFSFVSTTCTSSLAIGASCTVSVRFTPTAPAARTGTLSVATGAGTKTSSLGGTGTQQAATLSSSLAFGNVVVGSNSTLNATLTNTGNMALSVTVPTAGSVTGTDFSFVSTTCTSSLAIAASCTVSVRLTPTAAASRSGTLSVVTGAGTRSSSLSGTGTQQAATLSSSLAFGDVNVGSNSTLNATLTNTGNMALSVTVPGTGSVTGTDFSFVSTTCTSSLAIGASCTVSVRFTPSAVTSRTGTLSVLTGAGTRTSSLSGTGLSPPTTLSGSPTSIAFGTVSKGSHNVATLTVTNTGSSTASNWSVSVTSFFYRDGGTCPANGGSLAAGSSCTVRVAFDAGCFGVTRSGSVTIAGANFSSLVVPVSATVTSSGVCP
jgi:ribosomal protein L30E